MKNLIANEFDKLVQYAKLLAEDEHGKKVLELPDHSIIKLFRVKRLISKATFYSPARRFARNAKKLEKLAIPTVSMIALYKIKHIKRTAVHYQQLEGLMVREYLQANPVDTIFLANLGKFLAQMHSKGIFFRSAHFGNIIYTTDQKFGLIDISDMRIYPSPLSKNKRIRNLKHIYRLAEDIQLIKNTQLIEKNYLEHCGIKNPRFHIKFLETCLKLKQAKLH